MPAVTLFSLVDVSSGDDEKFVQFFKETRSFLKKQPGFISNQLFQSRTPKSSRRFMVVGNWENMEAFQEAINSEGWKKLMSGREMVLSPVPFEEVPLD